MDTKVTGYDVAVWAGFLWLRIGSVVGCCEHGRLKNFRVP
jgi:hypothetical protein